jgi:hypothetical protein
VCKGIYHIDIPLVCGGELDVSRLHPAKSLGPGSCCICVNAASNHNTSQESKQCSFYVQHWSAIDSFFPSRHFWIPHSYSSNKHGTMSGKQVSEYQARGLMASDDREIQVPRPNA